MEVVDLNGMRRHGALRGHLLAVASLAALEGGTRLVSGSHDTFIRRAVDPTPSAPRARAHYVFSLVYT